MTAIIKDVPNSHALVSLVMRWEPPKTPHCSDCRWATVSGSPDAPMVECAQGHGASAKPLPMLIRGKNARGFRAAITCPDFSSMSDDEGVKP